MSNALMERSKIIPANAHTFTVRVVCESEDEANKVRKVMEALCGKSVEVGAGTTEQPFKLECGIAAASEKQALDIVERALRKRRVRILEEVEAIGRDGLNKLEPGPLTEDRRVLLEKIGSASTRMGLDEGSTDSFRGVVLRLGEDVSESTLLEWALRHKRREEKLRRLRDPFYGELCEDVEKDEGKVPLWFHKRTLQVR